MALTWADEVFGTRRSAALGKSPSVGAGRQSLYETARLLPRGDDGGFAERFLEARRGWATHERHMISVAR
jgi:hypothetical protein